MATIQNVGTWIVRALGLLAGDAPTILDDRVQPVVDAFQGGQGVATWTPFRHDVTNVAAATTNIVAASLLRTRLAIVNVGRVGGAAPTLAAIRFSLRPDPSAINAELRLCDIPLGVATAAEFDWRTIGGGAMWWVVPPGFRLTLSLPTGDGATDRFVCNGIICDAPVGFKLW